MIQLVSTLLLSIAWVAVTGSASFLNLAFGFLLSACALAIVGRSVGGERYLARPVRILALALLFLSELGKSAVSVSLAVLKPRIDISPGILAFPLTVTSDLEITLLANLITLTPGTLSVDVSDDRRTLYIHALDCSDPQATRRQIAQGFERRIKEAFQ